MIAFVGARIVDGTGASPIEKGTIVVRAGRIQEVGPDVPVPQGARVVDLAGRTVVPGFVNAHGHVADTLGLESDPTFYTADHVRAQLERYARYGITTVASLGGDRDEAFKLRDAQDQPPLSRARIYVAGPVVASQNPAAARLMTGAVADMKADFVKIRVDDNLGTSEKMPPIVYRTVIDTAHARKLPVAAHVFYLDDAKELLRSGVDLLAHSIRDRDVDDEVIALFKERDVCLVPTLTREVSTFVYESEPAFFEDPFFLKEADPGVLEQLRDPERQKQVQASTSAQAYKKALDVASRNLDALDEAGVTIAMGTDSGPPGRFQGYFEHLEMELMVKAGMSPARVIEAATGDAARCLGLAGQVGTLTKNAWADLVVLHANPLEDILNTRTIESVWIAGARLPDHAARP